MTASDAIRFLTAEIEQQALMDKVPLTEIEKKMLLFSEVEPGAFADAKVAEEFERDYDDSEYEQKVTDLLRRARKRDRMKSELWREASKSLEGHDYYLLVMLQASM